MSQKKRILVIHPDMRATGGGNVVAAYAIEALKREYDVTVLSWSPADLEALNRFYGTSLRASELKSLSAPLFMRALARLLPYLSSFKYAFLLRMCRRIRNDYDVIISFNNEADFCCSGIQYVHDPPYWLQASRDKPRFGFGLLSPREMWAVFRGKYRPWMLVAGFSYDRMKHNLTLVNSHWTGNKIKELYGMRCLTVYPPVPGRFPVSPWEGREDGFVCIGRIAPWKSLEKIIEIIGALRSEIEDAHLHIIGTTEDRIYRREMLRLVRDSPWVFLNEDVSREELIKIVTGHRYGIHGMTCEPFGIAVAEMVRGGCIVFVPRNGGPMEIVGYDDRLLYDTAEEAVTKILRVMKNGVEQASLRKHLYSRKEQFSTERFSSNIRGIVRRFSSEAPSPSGAAQSTKGDESNTKVVVREVRSKVLILTPVKDAEEFLDGYFESIYQLTYPRSLISLAFLESDSSDDTYSKLRDRLPELKEHFRSASLWKKDFGFKIAQGIPRWAEYLQRERRTALAKSRNHLLFHALSDEDWVLWLDVDVIEYPPDVIERLLGAGKDIVQPHCVREYGGESFDLNAWRDRGKHHMQDLRGEGDLVRLDSVGGTMLLVRADIHRDGLIFPPFQYGRGSPLTRKRYFPQLRQFLNVLLLQRKKVRPSKTSEAVRGIKKKDVPKMLEIRGEGEIETEGLGMMAHDMGYECWGMPNLEIRHSPS